MVDPQAGTPETEPVVSESAGSAEAVQDGSETAKGLPNVDPALAAEWKSKAERVNKVEEEAAALRAQLQSIQQQAQLQNDPLAAMAADLQQRAPYDPDARAQLGILMFQVQQQAENRLVEEMHLLGVPREAWAQVKGMVQTSNYRMPVAQALAAVVPPKDTAMEKRLAEMQAELERLKKGSRPNPASGAASTTPAASTVTQDDTMPVSQYNALLRAGGAAALDAKRRKDAGSLKIDYNA